MLAIKPGKRHLTLKKKNKAQMSVIGIILVRIQSECAKIRTRITPNRDTFLYHNPFHAIVPFF